MLDSAGSPVAPAYLSPDDVEDVLCDFAHCAPGSVIGFDYVDPEVVQGMQRSGTRSQRQIRSGWTPSSVGGGLI